MRRVLTILFTLFLIHWVSAAETLGLRIDLAGEWRFSLDGNDNGIKVESKDWSFPENRLPSIPHNIQDDPDR